MTSPVPVCLRIARVAKVRIHNIIHSRSVSSTVNSDEISHFNRLAASWWDPNGPSRLLHRMNPLRLMFIHSLLPDSPMPKSSRWLEGFSVLDVGCGAGILTENLSRLGAFTDGLDASPEIIKVAKAHLRTDPKLNDENMPNYICCSIHDHDKDKKYDFVTAMEVVEHVDYPATFLKQAAGHVKPGGWLVLSTISRNSLSWLGAIVASEHFFRIVPKGTHSWEKFIKKRELKEYTEKLQDEDGKPWAKEVKTQDCIYDPLSGEWMFTSGMGFPSFNYFFAVRRTI